MNDRHANFDKTVSRPEMITIDAERLQRYIRLLASHVGGPVTCTPDAEVPLLFFNTLLPLKIYDLEPFVGRKVLLRGLKFRRGNPMLQMDARLTRVRKIRSEAEDAEKKRNCPISIEEEFYEASRLTVCGTKRVLVI